MFNINSVLTLFVIQFALNCKQVIEAIEYQMEAKLNQEFKDLKCYYPEITSITKMRDNMYFVSTKNQKFWFLSESDDATDENSRDLSEITKDWNKIDASIYYDFNAECGLQLRDKLVLINYSEKSKQNEILLGSLLDWKWSSMIWSQFEAFNLTKSLINWDKSVDAIASIDETLFIFQDNIQLRVDCVFIDFKWIYRLSHDYREVPLSGPFDAAYFDDQHKDTLPLYVFRGDQYFICYIKVTNNEFPTCELEVLLQNNLYPKPDCFVISDPNRQLFTSLFIQILLLLLLLIIMSVFSFIHLINLWYKSIPISTPLNQTTSFDKLSSEQNSSKNVDSIKPMKTIDKNVVSKE